jgi:hypothetical protein
MRKKGWGVIKIAEKMYLCIGTVKKKEERHEEKNLLPAGDAARMRHPHCPETGAV